MTVVAVVAMAAVMVAAATVVVNKYNKAPLVICKDICLCLACLVLSILAISAVLFDT
jgi:hypothetical protein